MGNLKKEKVKASMRATTSQGNMVAECARASIAGSLAGQPQGLRDAENEYSDTHVQVLNPHLPSLGLYVGYGSFGTSNGHILTLVYQTVFPMPCGYWLASNYLT